MEKRRLKRCLGLLGFMAVILLAGCANVGKSKTECDSFSIDAPGLTVALSERVAHPADLPAFCRIQGVIEPNIGFEARLPLAGWNGKYYQAGCGGYCGSVLPDKKGFSNTINEALKRGYATITTDNGHSGWVGDASWAKDNDKALAVYAHRGIFLTHKAGTALTERFYGRAPAREYFSGCSNGGRMAAMAAQRYPTLFDGILGGSGVLHLSYSGGVYGSWVVKANSRSDGSRILTHSNFASKLPALARSVLAQCDSVDGVKDGVIMRPRDCSVDVRRLPVCEGQDDQTCFAQDERNVIERWYRGPQDSAGKQLFPGMPPGSEPFWGVWFLDRDGKTAVGNGLGGDYAKYIGLPQETTDDYTALDFDFDEDPAKLGVTGELVDATSPDLSAFRDAGGKFLMWHGWADPLVLPDQSVAYFESVSSLMGGPDSVDPFFRLFMIPGHGHCWELPAGLPDRFNPIVLIENWVEDGLAPNHIRVEAFGNEPSAYQDALICPYPAEARYPSGSTGTLDGSCGP